MVTHGGGGGSGGGSINIFYKSEINIGTIRALGGTGGTYSIVGGSGGVGCISLTNMITFISQICI